MFVCISLDASGENPSDYMQCFVLVSCKNILGVCVWGGENLLIIQLKSYFDNFKIV